MRPGDFSPGNAERDASALRAEAASMRPGDFSPGNSASEAAGCSQSRASLQ